MREHLTQLIREVQRLARGNLPGKQLRTHVSIGDDGHGRLWFGYGYFDVNKVLWWPEGSPTGPAPDSEELSVEEGVERFLKAYGITE